jgi:mono/diheme cytochrome c family protein
MIAVRRAGRAAVLFLPLAAFACSRRPAPTDGGPAPTAAPAAAPAAAVPAATTASAKIPAATQTPAPAPPGQPAYEVRLGRDVYQHYCQTCHGETGAGDGFNAFNLDPHPRDLSDPAFQKNKTDTDLRDVIRRGGAGVGLSPLMPPWGRTLSGRQIDDVILHLRTLRRSGS